MKKAGFIRQANVLISRYLKLFFNDKQNLALTIAIPVLTIIVVTLVASGDMFCGEVDNQINDGYPILSWEYVEYEDIEESDEDKKDNVKEWDGNLPQQPQLIPMDSDGNEYSINSPADLQFIANAKGEWLKKTYYLNCDVDMNGHTIKPLGTSSEPFTGKFEGNGHIISNFVLETGEDCVGFFGRVSGKDAEINNIGIENAKIVDKGNSECVGLVVGFLEKGLVENCYSVDSKIDVKSDYVGGIVGNLDGDDEATVRNCYSRADIKVDGRCVGGIVGSVIKGSVQYTYFAGTIESKNSDNEYFGNIIGMVDDDEITDTTFKCVYDKEILSEFSAIGTDDGKGFDVANQGVEGWKTKKLQENASLIRKLEKEVDEEEPNGGFKNDGELADFSGTQTGLFMLVCVAIFVGICNSVQEICKERNILKREYMTNLRLSSYIISKLVVQGMVCAVQMLVVMLIFSISVRDKVYPTTGVILPSSALEVYITMFLVTFASDAIALLISSVVKNSSTANTFIPIILIVQIVFSGVLFDLGDAMDKFAGIMISKWGIGALAATYKLNESRMALMLKNPEIALQMGDEMTRIKDLFVSTPGNLVGIWLILIAFVVVCAIASGLILTRVKKDRR